MFKEFIFNIKIPKRKNAPETSLYVEVHTLENNLFDTRPVIFLIPGGPGNDHRVFKRHSSELREVARLIYLDPRGCGKSEKNIASSYTMENLIQDIEVIRSQLLHNKQLSDTEGFKKIILLGVSYGGMVSQGYAIQYPDAVEKLILVSTVPSFHFIETAKDNLKKVGSPEQIKVAEKLWEGSFKNPEQWIEYFKTMKPLYTQHIPLENESENLLLQKDSMSIECLNEGFKGFLRKFDYLPSLRKIRAKTLIFCGKTDFICDYRYSILMAKKIPNASLIVYNCPHAVPIDKHEDYIKVSKDFILDKKLNSDFLVKELYDEAI